MRRFVVRFVVAALVLSAAPALAHHTYAMFDQSATRSVSGSVARLQWMNPHAAIWVYVASTDDPGKFDLWKFENDSPNLLSQAGWTTESLPAGTKVKIEYFPLRDGSRGGHWVKGVTEDGRELVSPSSLRRLGGAK